MFYVKKVEIWEKGNSVDLGGGLIIDGELEKVREIKVDIQPYTRSQAKRDYGLDVDVTNTMFSAPVQLKPGVSVIVYQGDFYDVIEVIDWEEYVEAIINRRR